MADIKPDIHLRPEELFNKVGTLKYKVVEDNEKGFTVNVVEFPDLNGQPTHIAGIYNNWSENDMSTALQGIGFSCPIEDRIAKEENDKFRYCIKVLKIPALLAARITYDRKDLDLKKDFKLPLEKTKNTVFISGTDESGRGKSLTLAILALKRDVRIDTFDVYSAIGPKEYLRFFEFKGLTKKTSVSELLKTGELLRLPENKPPRPTRTIPLGENLDRMIDLLKGGQRPDFVLLEGISFPKKPFSADIVYYASTYGCEGVAYLNAGEGSLKYTLRTHQDGKIVYPPSLALPSLDDENIDEIVNSLNMLADRGREIAEII
jgi:hypothetical protein